jgi:hypothetical protein
MISGSWELLNPLDSLKDLSAPRLPWWMHPSESASTSLLVQSNGCSWPLSSFKWRSEQGYCVVTQFSTFCSNFLDHTISTTFFNIVSPTTSFRMSFKDVSISTCVALRSCWLSWRPRISQRILPRGWKFHMCLTTSSTGSVIPHTHLKSLHFLRPAALHHW